MARSREFAIYHRPVSHLVNGKFVRSTEDQRVRVLARAEGYALVRNPGAMPFVVSERDLDVDNGCIKGWTPKEPTR